MTPSISLEQLATKSKFTHKSQPKAHDSYMSEHIASHSRQKAPVLLPPSDSKESIARIEQIHNDLKKELAIRELNAISGTNFGDTLKGLVDIREKLKVDPRDQGEVIFPIDILLIVLLLARITGCNTAKGISQYYNDTALLRHVISITNIYGVATV